MLRPNPLPNNRRLVHTKYKEALLCQIVDARLQNDRHGQLKSLLLLTSERKVPITPRGELLGSDGC